MAAFGPPIFVIEIGIVEKPGAWRAARASLKLCIAECWWEGQAAIPRHDLMFLHGYLTGFHLVLILR